MGFLGRGFEPHIHHTSYCSTYLVINFFKISQGELETYPPRYTQEMKRLGQLTGPPVYPADLVSRRFRGRSVIRLSLGKLLVNL